VPEEAALAATEPEASAEQVNAARVSHTELYENTLVKATPLEYRFDVEALSKYFELFRELGAAVDRGEITMQELSDRLKQYAQGKPGSGFMISSREDSLAWYEYCTTITNTYSDLIYEMGLNSDDPETRPVVSPEQAKEFEEEFFRRLKADDRAGRFMERYGIEA
jgi:hypothetical protein